MRLKHPEYLTVFDEYRNKTLAEFQEILKRLPKKSAKTIQLGELCSMADYPHGVYLFFDDRDDLWYVGKATSRSFIERLPAHFDQRSGAWFNTLPKRIRKLGKLGYTEALKKALSLRPVLIGIKCEGHEGGAKAKA